MPQHVIHESYGDYTLRQNSNSLTFIFGLGFILIGISLFIYMNEFIAGILAIVGGCFFIYSWNKRFKVLGKKYKERSAAPMVRVSYG